MAFPTVSDRISRTFSSRATSQSVTLPATVNANDLLLIQFTCQYSAGAADPLSTPTGFTALATAEGAPAPPSRYSVGWFAKLADGTEDGTNVSFATVGSASITAVAEIRRIAASSWFQSIASGISISTVTSAIASSVSPPSVTASWGSDDNLFIVSAGAADDDVAFNSAPANYSQLTSAVTGAGTNNGCSVGCTERELAAASDSGGTFGLASTESIRCTRLVIRPAAAVTGNPWNYYAQQG